MNNHISAEELYDAVEEFTNRCRFDYWVIIKSHNEIYAYPYAGDGYWGTVFVLTPASRNIQNVMQSQIIEFVTEDEANKDQLALIKYWYKHAHCH